MAPSKDNFRISGPFNLTCIDWTNAYHRRSIAASLVQGAYVLQRDQKKNRQGSQALAPPWWESFGFKLKYPLVDKRDGSYFGAIYEYEHWPSVNNYPSHPPRYVISFRGTIKKWRTMVQDFKLDLLLTFNLLHLSSRLQHGFEIAKTIIEDNGPDNVWLAGHSLGAAIALMVGREIFKMGYKFETYLFNPPFPSTPIEHIADEKKRNVLRKMKSKITTLITDALAGHGQMPKYKEQFTILSGWIPHMFVHQSDPICCGYIRYFKVISNDIDDIEKLAAKNAILGQLIRGKDSEPVHLIPSANLTVHSTCNEHLYHPHGIDQWWRPDINCETINYEFFSTQPGA